MGRTFRDITSRWRVYPDFIVIGYQKTGTTFLYKYLSKHPNIMPASKKEIHFFNFSFGSGSNYYKAQFPLKIYKKYLERKFNIPFKTGEASPSYAIHPKAAKRIKELIPNTKLIFILRNPIDRAYSQYHYRKKRGMEELSFEEAIEEDNNRKILLMKQFERDELTIYNRKQIKFPYISISKYIEHLTKWYEVFPKEQILILKTEDFNENSQKELNKVCDFIGISKIEFKKLTKQNVGKYPEMNSETRIKLSEIYKDYNEALEKFLKIKLEWN